MEILKVIADNPALLEAVKTLLVDKFELDYSNMPVGLTNEQLGAFVLTRLEGRKLVEEAFKEIAKYKSHPAIPERKNEAR